MSNAGEAAPPKHVVVAGGSGFLGRRLTGALLDRGDRVTVLSRATEPTHDVFRGAGDAVAWAPWDGKTLGDWRRRLDGADAIVNYVGRTVDCVKTEENKRVIRASRVDSCRVLGEACRAVADAGGRAPPVWVQSATAHIVGDPVPLDAVCDESTPPGPMHEMAPAVGVAWEKAFDDARLPEQRGVTLRISFVIGPDGGAMARLSRITRLGLGGAVGHGRQWISWIHLDDLTRLVLDCIDAASYGGIYMVTSPNPVTNRDFMAALRKAYRRPWSPPAPAFAVKLVSRWLMNTDPELALLGRRCVPTRLLDEGRFRFAFETVEAAAADVATRGV